MSWFRRKPKQEPSAMTRDLSEMALSVEPSSIGLAPAEDPGRVWGALMETGYAEGVATLVALGDGTASLYFSGGGGIIGAGEHPAVREAVVGFLETAQSHRGELAPAASTPLPEEGRVRFYLRTFAGTLTAEAAEQDLGEDRHALSPLFYAGHQVITAMREASERT